MHASRVGSRAFVELQPCQQHRATVLRATPLGFSRHWTCRTPVALIRAHGGHRRFMQSIHATPAQHTSVSAASGVPPEVATVLKTADAICFDVDSTFCEDESIDELAAFIGVGEAIATMTAQAMGGVVTFQESLAARLGIMSPSAQIVEEFLSSHPPRISPGIPEIVAYCQSQGIQVFLVSGGFHQIIDPIAAMLGIPSNHVFANRILYNAAGSYAGFDPTCFTSRSGGKREAVQHLRATRGLQRVVMVGDGATDAEAKAPGGADVFVGYGGVVRRPAVEARADWYITDLRDLLAALQRA
ncbi:hypothetical protein ACKKBG_A09215 [Auxenochlorella protothecoides x Auxenochlorella symbiontica]